MVKALDSASRFPGIKRFVYTSSSLAAVSPTPNVEFDVSPEAYNQESVKLAREPPFDATNIWNVYAASKVLAEQAAWKWVADHKPHFGFSTTLPNANFGPSLSKEHQGYPSTGGWPKMFFDNDFAAVAFVPPRKSHHLAFLPFPSFLYELRKIVFHVTIADYCYHSRILCRRARRR